MYGYQGGKGGEWEELGDWGWHIYTIDTIYKIDKSWEHTVQHRELYLKHCGDFIGKEVQKGGDICICATDSFCCIAETITVL